MGILCELKRGSMNKNKSRTIALNGILIALMIAMTCTMLVTGGMAFLPLVVLVVGSVIVGKWTALILGFTFGLISMVSAFIFPSPTAPIFQNPLVSILPRILIGVVAYGVYSLVEFVFKKCNAKREKALNEYLTKSISTSLGAIFAVFFNTLLVLAMIWIVFNGKQFGDINVNKAYILSLISINFVVEIIVTPALSVPVVFAVDKFLKRNQKQVVTDEDILALDERANDDLTCTTLDCANADSENIDFQKEAVSKDIDINNIDNKNIVNAMVVEEDQNIACEKDSLIVVEQNVEN